MATRRERVVLELEDDFTSGMTRAAAATALLDEELKHMGGSAKSTHKPLSNADSDVRHLGQSARSNSSEIDKLSGRMKVMRDVAITIGPAFVPIGGEVIPAVAGLANELGFAAIAAGTAVLAFQGISTALKALNTYRLDPTAANLLALREEMLTLPPSAREFVRSLESLEPVLNRLKATAQAGLFPGLVTGISALSARIPQIEHLISTVSAVTGDLVTKGAESLSSTEWDSFFASLQKEAQPALEDLGRTLGSVTHGLAELWQAFIPVSNDFGSGLVRLSGDFDHWASGLSKTKGFQDFIAYLEQEGPQVLSFLGALGTDFAAISKAAAPLGGAVLEGLTGVAKALASIANSRIGAPLVTALAAVVAYNRALQLSVTLQKSAFGASLIGNIRSTSSGLGSLTSNVRSMRGEYSRLNGAQAVLLSGFSNTTQAAHETRSTLAGLGKSAAVVAGLGVAASGVAGKFGLANTATLTLGAAFMGLPLAAGAAIGGLLDAQKAASGLQSELHAVATSRDPQTLTANLKALQDQRTDLGTASNLGDAIHDELTEAGAAIFDNHWSALTDNSFLTKAIDQTKAKLAGLTGQQRLAAASAGAYGAAEQRAARQTLAIESAASASAQKFVTLGKDVNNAKVTLSSWIRELSAEARALQEFGENAEKAARKGLDQGLIKSLEHAGPTGALRMKQLADASVTQIARANRAWRELTNGPKAFERAMLGVSHLKINIDTVQARSEIQQLKAMLSSIPKTERTDYFVTQIDRYSKPKVKPGGAANGGTILANAAGGHIAGQRASYTDLELIG